MTDPSLGSHLLGRVIERGGTCTFDGAAHAGKTTLMFQYLAALQETPPEGATFFGLPIPYGVNAAYIAGDKPTRKCYSYARECGLDLSTLHTWFLDSPHPFISRHERDDDPLGALQIILNTFTNEHPELDLVIIEGFGGWLGANVNSYTSVIPKLQQMIEWNNAHPRVALVGIGHAGKARNDFSMKRPMDRHNGSGAALAYTLGNMILETPEEVDSHYFKWTLTPRTAKPEVVWLDHRADGMGFQPIDPEAAIVGMQSAPSKADEAMHALLDAVRGRPGGMRRAQILAYAVERRQVARGTARRVFDQLTAAGKLVNEGARGWYSAAPGV